jgi:nicotinamidase-related amidase
MAEPSAGASTALFVCDVQERFRAIISHGGAVIRTIAFLLDVAAHLGWHVYVSEQAPRAFGPTVPELVARLPPVEAAGGVTRWAKSRFSMVSDDVISSLRARGVTAVLLCGLEAHICVLQTARDLRDAGVAVYVVTDAVTSTCRRDADRTVALGRLQADVGAVLTTAESVAFEALGDAAHPAFRAVSAALKARNAADDEAAAAAVAAAAGAAGGGGGGGGGAGAGAGDGGKATPA